MPHREQSTPPDRYGHLVALGGSVVAIERELARQRITSGPFHDEATRMRGSLEALGRLEGVRS